MGGGEVKMLDVNSNMHWLKYPNINASRVTCKCVLRAITGDSLADTCINALPYMHWLKFTLKGVHCTLTKCIIIL